MIFLVGAILALFFESLLLSKKNKSLADKILAFWMFFIGLHLFFYYLHYTKIILNYPILYAFGGPMPYIHAPLLFLYTSVLTGRIVKWKSIMLLHFWPFAVYYLYHYKYFFYSDEQRLEFIKRISEGNEHLFYLIFFITMLIHAFTYLTIIFILIRNHEKNLKDKFSYTDEKINLHWLRNLLIGLTFIWIVVALENLVIKSVKADDIIYISVVLFVFFTGYKGVKQGNIFITQPEIDISNDKQLSDTDSAAKRYSKSGLKEGEADRIKQRLIDLMSEKKLFLEEKLSLPNIADQLDIHPNYLSQVINERFNQNFYDFINAYRVEEFKKLVLHPKYKNMTFFSLAMESGFSSKGSFNSAFKKVTGQTPSEYVKSLK